MRISELIKRLENVRSEHGDLYVLIGQPDSTGEGEGEGDDDLVDMTGECMNVKTIHSVFQHRVRWGQVLEEGRLVHGCRPFVVHLDDGGIRREEGRFLIDGDKVGLVGSDGKLLKAMKQ